MVAEPERHHPNDQESRRMQLSLAAKALDPREREELLESIDRQLAEIEQRPGSSSSGRHPRDS